MAPRDLHDLNNSLNELPPDLSSAGLAGRGRMPAAAVDEDQEIWLLSYSDLVTLLFSVFVMLLAITTLRDQLPTTPLPPDSPTFGPTSVAPAPLPRPWEEPDAEDKAPPDTPPAPLADGRPRLNPDEVAVTAPDLVAARWRDRLSALGVPTAVTVSVAQNRVGIGMTDAILFATGQVELTPPGRDLLRRLAPVLAATRGDIVVEGHTDSTPVTGGRFATNWELSAARAASVVRRLIDLGIPAQRLSAVGYADTRPLAPGTDPASLARNRRVTITIQADG